MRKVWNLPWSLHAREPSGAADAGGDESVAQACVTGTGDGRIGVNLGGTAGFPVPLGMEIRLFRITKRLDGEQCAKNARMTEL